MSGRTLAQRTGPGPGEGETPENDPEYVINRVTIGIIPKAWADLRQLIASTRYNRTDVINRAISIYAMVHENVSKGDELVFRNPKTGKERIVEII